MNTSELTSFSSEISQTLENAMTVINRLTDVNNQKIREFRAKVNTLPPELEELATIVSTQNAIIEEKYQVIYTLISDLYAKMALIAE